MYTFAVEPIWVPFPPMPTPNARHQHNAAIFTPTDSNDAIMEINQRFTKVLEETVKKYHEQYFWFHRKWNREMYKGISRY